MSIKVKVTNETTGKTGYAVIKDNLEIDNPLELINPDNWEKLVIDGEEININDIKDKVDFDGVGIYFYE